MVKPKDGIYVNHILSAINLIEGFTANATFEEFCDNPMMHSAVTRQLEIIGEAAKRLSIELKTELHLLPWRKITGTRDVLIHDYIDVDLEIIWKAATEDVQTLRQALKHLQTPTLF